MTPSLIFDLDGTLVDSLPGIAGSLNRTLAKNGLPEHPQQAVRAFIGNGLHMLVKRGMPKDSDETQIDELVAEFKEDYTHTWSEGTHPYPAISHLLKELQRDGHQLAVLSNKTQDFTRTICRDLFPLIHFTLVVGQQDGIPHKPHPLGALRIATAMGRAPKDCILIGDSMADIETADNAGMQHIACTWGYQDRKQLLTAGATCFADSPTALPRILGELSEALAKA